MQQQIVRHVSCILSTSMVTQNRPFSKKALLRIILAIVLSLPIAQQSSAVPNIVPKKVYTVTKNGTGYRCYDLPKKTIFVIKQGKEFIPGGQAVSDLKRSLTLKGKLRKASGKKKLQSLKDKVKAGTDACLNPESDDPNDGGSTSLTKLTRPLTRTDIQYLLDKAALGLSSREEYLVDIGLNQGIDALVDELMAQHAEPAGLMDRVADRLDGQMGLTTTQTPSGQRGALLDLMINTTNPYQEKFALFLQSVWTVSGDVIGDETFRHTFWTYYNRLRTFAYGNSSVVDLGVEITKDPLMLIYLNNELNVRWNPNENYARELMELFTMGPTNSDGQANYTETQPDGSGDIATAARMLTGWRVSLNYQINELVASYVDSRHKVGPHTMFPGTPYQFTGENYEDLVRGIFAHHPGAKQYYASEILKMYLTPNPPRALVEQFADVIASNGFRLQDAMSSLLKSEAFYDGAYKDTVPLNSLEFAAKTARIMELYNGVNASNQEYQLQKMGLFFNMPPSVFWYNPNTWSSSSIALEKANWVAYILDDNSAQNAAGWTPQKILPVGTVTNTQLIDSVKAKVGLTTLTSAQTQSMVSYLSNQLQYNSQYTPFTYDNNNATHRATKGLGMFYMMFITPEFNLL